MFFIGVLIATTLAIAGSAAFFSIYGLAQIFTGSFWPVVIMASSLEAGKLVAASYVYRFWNKINIYLKAYYISAIAVLMIITSAGIFGFLSRAHIEQSANSTQSVAQVERLQADIERQQMVVDRADIKIKQLETSGTSANASVQQQIDKEQARLDAAYKRIQDAEQSLRQRISPYLKESERITQTLTNLQTAINSGNIKQAQSIVGTRPDGRYGPDTVNKVEQFRAAQNARQKELLNEIESIRNQGSQTLTLAQNQVNESNKIITRLSSQLGSGSSADIDSIIEAERMKIEEANKKLDALMDEKFEMETNVRQLEAEVGPIKYIAAFFVGKTDATTLEQAVSWLIMIIIFAFDPLAVALTIGANIAITEYTGVRVIPKRRTDNELVVKPEPDLDEGPKPEPVDGAWDEPELVDDHDPVDDEVDEPNPSVVTLEELLDKPVESMTETEVQTALEVFEDIPEDILTDDQKTRMHTMQKYTKDVRQP